MACFVQLTLHTPCSENDSEVLGTSYMACSLGKVHFELDVCNAVGDIVVGFAGTNFGAKCVGGDETSWGIYKEGKGYHRQVLHTESSAVTLHL
jgi:hypothetical protein